MRAHTYRIEHDLLGDRQVPVSAYYRVHTLRAQENFSITNQTVQTYPHFINAIASVKEACAKTNKELGQLEPQIADAIIKACQEIRSGKFHDHFVVDIIQGGAGTSMPLTSLLDYHQSKLRSQFPEERYCYLSQKMKCWQS